VFVFKLRMFFLSAFFLFAFLPGTKQDFAFAVAVAQVGTQFPPHTGDLGQQRQSDAAERKMHEEQQKKLNQQRQAELKRDTDKLLLLATQLKQAVDKSNENTLSLDVIRKAGEIEKLAKSVKEKMRGQN
jgi:hypothetical protein